MAGPETTKSIAEPKVEDAIVKMIADLLKNLPTLTVGYYYPPVFFFTCLVIFYLKNQLKNSEVLWTQLSNYWNETEQHKLQEKLKFYHQWQRDFFQQLGAEWLSLQYLRKELIQTFPLSEDFTANIINWMRRKVFNVVNVEGKSAVLPLFKEIQDERARTESTSSNNSTNNSEHVVLEKEKNPNLAPLEKELADKIQTLKYWQMFYSCFYWFYQTKYEKTTQKIDVLENFKNNRNADIDQLINQPGVSDHRNNSYFLWDKTKRVDPTSTVELLTKFKTAALQLK